MRGFLVRLLITALGLWVADQLLAGLAFDSTGAVENDSEWALGDRFWIKML